MALMPTRANPTGDARPPRERILHTAHDLFYRDGIRATGIDRVIAQASVTKVTFYRQFASKDELVLAFLEFRHQRWMAWFAQALARHGGTVAAVVPALREWLGSPDYRGCAFINSVGELGPVLPRVMELARGHKRDMTDAIAGLMRPGRGRAAAARAIALAVDGAIVQAQVLESAEPVLDALALLLKGVAGAA
jgi:AcrR family transcriptional regulator